MNSKVIVIGLLGLGIFAYSESLSYKKKSIQARRLALINISSDPKEKATVTPIFNKMTDDEIIICYDVVVIKLYGQNIPLEIKNQMKIISDKYNIFK